MLPYLLQIAAMIIRDPGLQDQAAQPVALALAKALPDVTEDAVAGFLRKVADRLEVANP